nr:hypothetical protein [Streptomyces sp. TLI_146]
MDTDSRPAQGELSAKGLTHGEISAHLAEVSGAEASKRTISTIPDAVVEGMSA